LRRVELEVLPPDRCAGPVHRCAKRHPGAAARLPPERHERAGGGIERAAARTGDLGRALHDGEQLAADRNGPAAAVLEAAQFAVRPIVAQQAVERPDASKRFLCGLPRAAFVGRVKHEPDRQAHVDLRELECLCFPWSGRLRHNCRRRDQDNRRHR
jgi:hypothetical protein